MKIAGVEPTIVSVPYTHREVSSRVRRDGVTAVLVKITTDDGFVGWGECCPGPNVESVQEAVRSAIPYLLGQDPWRTEALANLFYGGAHWDLREPTGNFAFVGIDTALHDIIGKACGQPVHRLYGGPVCDQVNYFHYLATADAEAMAADAAAGSRAGYNVFYYKVGIDFARERDAAIAIRQAVGDRGRIRVDANGAWSVAEARRHLTELDRVAGIDFAEQPVRQDPLRSMAELRQMVEVPLAANEGLWRSADVWEAIRARAADVLCFSPVWVGSLARFHRLAHAAALEGLAVCRHTHGELGLLSAACQHLCLTLPNLTDGNQQTHAMLSDDILRERLPITSAPDWGVMEEAGLGVEVDEARVAQYHELYQSDGQFLPYGPEILATGA